MRKTYIERKLDDEKKKWNSTVADLVAQIRNVDMISEAQVLMLSYRHQLVDKLIEMKNIISRQETNIWTTRQARYVHYKTGGINLKLNQSEINEFYL